MRRSLIALTALMLSTLAAHAGETQKGMNSLSQLDGTRWTITAMPNEAWLARGESNFTDTLTFANSQVSFENSEMREFAAGQYATKLSKDRQTFTAMLKSPKEGTAHYRGNLNSNRDQMYGNIEWTRADGKQVVYTFQGKKVE